MSSCGKNGCDKGGYGRSQRQLVWDLYVDCPTAVSNPCFCCCDTDITVDNLHLGKMMTTTVSTVMTGSATATATATVDVLRPICHDCYKACSTDNVDIHEWMLKSGYQRPICIYGNCRRGASCGWFCCQHRMHLNSSLIYQPSADNLNNMLYMRERKQHLSRASSLETLQNSDNVIKYETTNLVVESASILTSATAASTTRLTALPLPVRRPHNIIMTQQLGVDGEVTPVTTDNTTTIVRRRPAPRARSMSQQSPLRSAEPAKSEQLVSEDLPQTVELTANPREMLPNTLKATAKSLNLPCYPAATRSATIHSDIVGKLCKLRYRASSQGDMLVFQRD